MRDRRVHAPQDIRIYLRFPPKLHYAGNSAHRLLRGGDAIRNRAATLEYRIRKGRVLLAVVPL
jgi:hypothetical protein